MEKCWTSARLAAPANSVRTADEQLCEVGVAGLSLRDITCKSVDASRHRKIAGISVCWKTALRRSRAAGTLNSLRS